MTMTRFSRILIGVLALGALLLGCGSSASTPPSVASPSAAGGPPVASGGTGIVLDRTPPIGCDAVGVDYTSATIRIDPASDPDVWAETDAAKKLTVKWTDGFKATDGSTPTIVGPKGEEVAHDGTKVDVPAAAYPRLAGYFVCLGTDAIYVLEADPQ
jgi:hypothetical protein